MTLAEFIARERELLHTHIPELRDPAIKVKFRAALLKAASEYGFSEQEMKGVKDHRIMLVLRDAMIHLGLWTEE